LSQRAIAIEIFLPQTYEAAAAFYMARRLPGFGVLHSVLRDETTVFHTQSASEQAQLVNIAIAMR
jgi:hypothetical protein